MLASILLVLVFNLAFTGQFASPSSREAIRRRAHLDAAPLINEESMIDSDENDASVRSKKDTGVVAAQQLIPAPLRRHHLKFGVLGKRYSYGYLGKRANGKTGRTRISIPSVALSLVDVQVNEDFEDWLNNLRERRAGRPQYGMLG